MASKPKGASWAKKLCGRRQDDQPQEELVVPPPELISEEERENQEKLFAAVESCNIQVIKRLAEKLGSFKNIKDKKPHERTALHVLAGMKPDSNVKKESLEEMYQILKEKGCDINCGDYFGNTPVKLAAEKGCIEVLQCLLKDNADIKIPDKLKKDTPLHWAAKNNMLEAAKLLIGKGCDNLNPQNEDRQTPLHLAVIEGHKTLVELLICCGADKNLTDKNDSTPLVIARKKGDREDIVELLNTSLEGLLTKNMGKKFQIYGRTKVQNRKGRVEHVVSDSDSPAISDKNGSSKGAAVVFHVSLEGNATAAIGPQARVDISTSNPSSSDELPQSSGTPPPGTPASPVSPMQAAPTAPPEEEEKELQSSSRTAPIGATPASPVSPMQVAPTAPPEEEEKELQSSSRTPPLEATPSSPVSPMSVDPTAPLEED